MGEEFILTIRNPAVIKGKKGLGVSYEAFVDDVQVQTFQHNLAIAMPLAVTLCCPVLVSQGKKGFDLVLCSRKGCVQVSKSRLVGFCSSITGLNVMISLQCLAVLHDVLSLCIHHADVFHIEQVLCIGLVFTGPMYVYNFLDCQQSALHLPRLRPHPLRGCMNDTAE